MDALVRNNPSESRYEVVRDDRVAGFAAYERGDGEIVFTHTEVDSAFEGQGVGSTLASSALDDAREHGLAVLPKCEFIAGYIKRHEQYADLVPAARRADFGL